MPTQMFLFKKLTYVPSYSRKYCWSLLVRRSLLCVLSILLCRKRSTNWNLGFLIPPPPLPNSKTLNKSREYIWTLVSLFVKLMYDYLFIYFLNVSLINLFIYIHFWLCWVFVSVRGLSPVAASGGHSSSRCAGLSPSRPLSLRSTGSRRAGSAVVAHGLSCSVACGILPDQGSNPCPLHWQADS